MHRLLFLLSILLATCHPRPQAPAARARQAVGDTSQGGMIEVRERSVVAFWLTAADTLAAGTVRELREDFEATTAEVEPLLREAGVRLVETGADSIVVVLEGGPPRTVVLTGLDYPFGYVLVEPGYPETILTGLTEDDELMAQVDWYFGLDEEPEDSTRDSRIVLQSPTARGSGPLMLASRCVHPRGAVLPPAQETKREWWMKVADVMQTALRTIRGADSIGEAVTLLADSHVSGAPVVDDHGRLIGVLSSSDILEALAEHNEPEAREQVFDETAVQDLMTPRPETISPEADLKDAAQRMLYLEIHRLFVERNGNLVGVVTSTDLVRALAGSRV